MKKKKILVLGGTGFIGYHLLKRALLKKYKCYSVSKSKPKKSRKLKNVRYLICNITDKNLLEKKLENYYDYIVNLSGYVDHSKNSEIEKIHYNGCKNLVEIFKKKNIRSFVQIGSGLEYGNKNSPQKETFRCKPKTKYAISKLRAVKYLEKNYKKFQFPFTALRLYQAYGPKQDVNRLIPYIIKCCLKDKEFPCTSGSQLRDFLYIDDLVDLIFTIFNSRKSRGNIFNVGSGKNISVKKLITLIVKIIKKGKPRFNRIKMRKDEINKMYPDISKVKRLLNWYPKTNLERGLNKTINFYRK